MTEGERQRLKRTGCLSSSWLQVQSGAASGARIAALGESKPALTHPQRTASQTAARAAAHARLARSRCRWTGAEDRGRGQAAKEHAAVAGHLQQVLAGLGLPADAVPADELAQACRHACDMRMVRTRSLEEECTQATADEWGWMLELEGREYPHALYVLVRAADRFRALQVGASGRGAAA